MRVAVAAPRKNMTKNPPDFSPEFDLARLAQREGDYGLAKARFENILIKHPDDFDALNRLGEICIQLKQFDEAVAYLTKLESLRPSDDATLCNLAVALMHQGMLGLAEIKLLCAIQINPSSFNAYINLGSLKSYQGDPKGLLHCSLKAVELDPGSDKAYLNLGAALEKLAQFDAAKIAFETALDLNPKCIEASMNLAHLEAHHGDVARAVQLYETVLHDLPATEAARADLIKYSLSYQYLRQGRLAEGWDYYDFGFDPFIPLNASRSPARTFIAPEWDGSPLEGRRLLVWREQGVGDEIMFMTCLPELERAGGPVVIECEPRLVTTIARSFPSMSVRAENFRLVPGMRSLAEDYDVQIAVGSLPRLFRQTLSDFARSVAYIKPDPEKVEKFKQRLATDGQHRRKIGICWRSGMLDPLRNQHYCGLPDWGSIFSLPDCDLVNLQYGDCEEELREAEQLFGVSILRWSDLDLKNDFDSVWALMASLDSVVTVGTAVCSMAGALGINTKLLQIKNEWTQLGTNFYPFFPAVRVFNPVDGEILSACLPEIALKLLQDFQNPH